MERKGGTGSSPHRVARFDGTSEPVHSGVAEVALRAVHRVHGEDGCCKLHVAVEPHPEIARITAKIQQIYAKLVKSGSYGHNLVRFTSQGG